MAVNFSASPLSAAAVIRIASIVHPPVLSQVPSYCEMSEKTRRTYGKENSGSEKEPPFCIVPVRSAQAQPMVKLGKNLRGMLQPFLLTVFERKSDHARDSAPADDAGSAEVDLIQAVIPLHHG